MSQYICRRLHQANQLRWILASWSPFPNKASLPNNSVPSSMLSIFTPIVPVSCRRLLLLISVLRFLPIIQAPSLLTSIQASSLLTRLHSWVLALSFSTWATQVPCNLEIHGWPQCLNTYLLLKNTHICQWAANFAHERWARQGSAYSKTKRDS